LKKAGSPPNTEHRRPRVQLQPARDRAIPARPANALTLHDRSVALPDNVREFLDWLIDEELKRWLREEQ
jgi:hypothetical protein